MGSPPYRVKALFDYTSSHEDDLGFGAGQIITVTDEEDADWYFGEFEQDGAKQQGLFPRNFVQKLNEPMTPPRPARPARPKQEAEESYADQDTSHAQPVREPRVAGEDEPEHTKTPLDQPAPAGGLEIETGTDEPESDQAVKPTEAAPSASAPTRAEPRAPTQKKPGPVTSPKSPPSSPPTKQAPGGSFKDRIAAFNKPAAPPVAPKKPGNLGQSAGSGFVKKPFVAPPPSGNAYVPPPPRDSYIPHKRGSDAETAPPIQAPAEVPPVGAAEDNVAEPSEEQPKPTKLKDRIALLQKQQLEQAARHAEAAQKKEKPKKPPKKSGSQQSEAMSATAAGEEERVEDALSQNEAGETQVAAKPAKRRSKADDIQGIGATSVPRALLSDTNDADQSAGGDTEDGSEMQSTPVDSRAQPHEDTVTDKALREAEEAESDDATPPKGSDEEEEEEVDPEVKRRMEIRDRMAKMSGGMGMAGMFGPGGGLPGMAPKKTKMVGARSAEHSTESQNAEAEADEESRRPVPMIPMPGMSFPTRQKVQSPESEDDHASLGTPAAGLPHPRDPAGIEDNDRVDDEEVKPPAASQPTEREKPRKRLSDRPVPAPPVPSHEPQRGAPPPPPASSRPVPVPAVPSARPPPPKPDAELPSPPQAEESDEDEAADLSSTYHRAPPIPPPAAPGSQPPRPPGPRSPRTSDADSGIVSEQSLPPRATPRQPGRVPPIPGPVTGTSPPQSRAPPPPPPTQAPPSRRSTDRREPRSGGQATLAESDEEVTECDGVYDTDIASEAPHKDALKARGQDLSDKEALAGDDPSLHHAGLPSIGPSAAPPPIPSSAAPRAVPPPPPSQPPKRQSSDMPRTIPPRPPLPSKQESSAQEALTPREEIEQAFSSPPLPLLSPRESDLTRTLSPVSSPMGTYLQPSSMDGTGADDPGSARHQMPSPNLPPPGPPRRSLEVPAASGATRRSTDAPRLSGEQGFIAQDVDLGRANQWWRQRRMPPPVFQGRNDILLEIEESPSQSLTIKHVYVLFIDYSQTIFTARYEETNPSQAELSQRHDAPPPPLRQDQLEEAHTRFGARLADMTAAKANSVVGNGTAFGLVGELLASFPDALPPVGTRAYGSMIYTNMANASVQQHDQIRAGDIVTFRNAKLQGHRGAIKQKYSVDVGKPDHVAIVVDWDGTKKKVRAWEQGRESKKVKMESFKLDDLRSGEVKIWRIVARDWVGWGR